MRQRIRYERQNEEVFISKQKFRHTTNGALYKVLLNEVEMRFYVIDDIVDMTAATGSAVSMHKLKIAAKKALTQLGISFNEEERERAKVVNEFGKKQD